MGSSHSKSSSAITPATTPAITKEDKELLKLLSECDHILNRHFLGPDRNNPINPRSSKLLSKNITSVLKMLTEGSILEKLTFPVEMGGDKNAFHYLASMRAVPHSLKNNSHKMLEEAVNVLRGLGAGKANEVLSARDAKGFTPISLAVSKAVSSDKEANTALSEICIDRVSILAKTGLALNVANNSGQTPIALTKEASLSHQEENILYAIINAAKDAEYFWRSPVAPFSKYSRYNRYEYGAETSDNNDPIGKGILAKILAKAKQRPSIESPGLSEALLSPSEAAEAALSPILAGFGSFGTLSPEEMLGHLSERTGANMVHFAAKENNVELIKKLKALGFALDVPDRNGYTPIARVAVIGRKSALLYLLDEGCSTEFFAEGKKHSILECAAARDENYSLSKVASGGRYAETDDRIEDKTTLQLVLKRLSKQEILDGFWEAFRMVIDRGYFNSLEILLEAGRKHTGRTTEDIFDEYGGAGVILKKLTRNLELSEANIKAINEMERVIKILTPSDQKEMKIIFKKKTGISNIEEEKRKNKNLKKCIESFKEKFLPPLAGAFPEEVYHKDIPVLKSAALPPMIKKGVEEVTAGAGGPSVFREEEVTDEGFFNYVGISSNLTQENVGYLLQDVFKAFRETAEETEEEAVEKYNKMRRSGQVDVVVISESYKRADLADGSVASSDDQLRDAILKFIGQDPAKPLATFALCRASIEESENGRFERAGGNTHWTALTLEREVDEHDFVTIKAAHMDSLGGPVPDAVTRVLSSIKGAELKNLNPRLKTDASYQKGVERSKEFMFAPCSINERQKQYNAYESGYHAVFNMVEKHTKEGVSATAYENIGVFEDTLRTKYNPRTFNELSETSNIISNLTNPRNNNIVKLQKLLGMKERLTDDEMRSRQVEKYFKRVLSDIAVEVRFKIQGLPETEESRSEKESILEKISSMKAAQNPGTFFGVINEIITDPTSINSHSKEILADLEACEKSLGGPSVHIEGGASGAPAFLARSRGALLS